MQGLLGCKYKEEFGLGLMNFDFLRRIFQEKLNFYLMRIEKYMWQLFYVENLLIIVN